MPDVPGPEVNRAEGPRVEVEAIGRRATDDPAIWLFTWRVRNLEPESVTIRQAWLPHGKFRCERQAIEPPAVVRADESVQLEFPVRCREDPGTIVENSFVILIVGGSGAEWQVFARLRVTFGDDGAPEAETVLITTQQVGFSA